MVLCRSADGTRLKAKIIDFGLSKAQFSKMSVDASAVGTSGYIAPESGEDDETCQIDIFSYGCVLVFLLGRHHADPFSGFSQRNYFKKLNMAYIRREDLVPDELSDIEDDQTRSLVRSCFNIEPEERPTAGELLAELEK